MRGVAKKLRELSALTGAQVCLQILPQDQTGPVVIHQLGSIINTTGLRIKSLEENDQASSTSQASPAFPESPESQQSLPSPSSSSEVVEEMDDLRSILQIGEELAMQPESDDYSAIVHALFNFTN